MAKRRHGGLGRGLDALIPPARRENTDRNNNGQTAQGSPAETEAGSGQSAQGAAPGTEQISADPVDHAAGQGAQTGAAQGGQNSAGQGEAGPSLSSGADSAGQSAAGAVFGESAARQGTGGVSGESASQRGTGAVNSAGSSIAAAQQESGAGSSTGNTAAAEQQGTGAGSLSGTSQSGTGGGDIVRMLRLSQVDPDRSQPRKRFEEEALEELADSIRQFGVLQPILVRKNGSRYEIIAGERRWRASRKAGLREIPAIIREYSNQEAVELSLIENIQREDLNPIEEAKAFKRLLEEFGLRQEDLAARVSKSRTAITNAIRLLKLDERVQEMVVEGALSMGHARALIPVEIPEEQYLLAQQIAEKHLSVRDVEKLVKKLGTDRAGQKAKQKDAGKVKDPALELAYKEIEERLKQSLGTKASIRHSGDGAGKLEIEFYSHEDLEKIIDLLT